MDPVFRTVVILCLSVLFVSAAAHKLQNRALFLDQLEAYGILPKPLVGPGAFALALIELTLAAALLVPFMATTALYGRRSPCWLMVSRWSLPSGVAAETLTVVAAARKDRHRSRTAWSFATSS